MSWLRTSRLAGDGSQLAAAIHEYANEHGDAEALGRLEQRLGAALATPSAAPTEGAAPAWLLSVSAVAAVLALALLLQREVPEQHTEPSPAVQRFSSLEIASRLGVSPRELASQAAMDMFTPRAH